jgi:tRNA uridine 5-carboxymethylaminomethyl modification enzyme
MFTSRAEYRLLLREDNADLRLLEKGYELGLHDLNTYKELLERREEIKQEISRLKTTVVVPSKELAAFLEERRSAPVQEPTTLDKLLKRPELTYEDICKISPPPKELSERVKEQVEISCKYEGYIRRQEAEVKKFKNLESIRIPDNFSYKGIPGLSNELIEKLTAIQPRSLGQASRIPGMTPAALSILMIYIRKLSLPSTSEEQQAAAIT